MKEDGGCNVEHAHSGCRVVCSVWCMCGMLLVCDGCVQVKDKPSIRMVVGVGHVYVLIVWDGRDLCDVGNHGFDDDENGWSMLSQEQLHGWSTHQQRVRVPAVHSEGMWDGSGQVECRASCASGWMCHVVLILLLLCLCMSVVTLLWM